MIDDRPMIPCIWCGKPTPMLGTKMCDACYELVTRVQANPGLARRVLAEMKDEESRDH